MKDFWSGKVNELYPEVP